LFDADFGETRAGRTTDGGRACTICPARKKGFDFIRVDTDANRPLLAHKGNKSFDIFDLDTRKLLKVVPSSTSQDATPVAKRGCYFASGNRMVIVDSTQLEISSEVPIPANTDLIAFNPMTGLVCECNDTDREVWVIGPAVKKIVTTVNVDGSGVEDLGLTWNANTSTRR
jgi:hypothetical protein